MAGLALLLVAGCATRPSVPTATSPSSAPAQVVPERSGPDRMAVPERSEPDRGVPTEAAAPPAAQPVRRTPRLCLALGGGA
ncbi:MAG: hypothetical protein ACKOE3_00600, partial [Betaproteobacteria bacterium]